MPRAVQCPQSGPCRGSPGRGNAHDGQERRSPTRPCSTHLSASADWFGIAEIAGEYQVLFLSATDYRTGAGYEATFGGWGWQAWGGAALPLSGRSRLFGEVFFNSGEVGRDVDDPVGGVTYRESVDADGAGMRFGLSWGF